MLLSNKLLILILIILISIIILLSYYSNLKKQKEAEKKAEKNKQEILSIHLELDDIPETTAPANIDNNKPYHSLDLPAAVPQQLSQITAQQCYELNTAKSMEKLGNGNYSQCTNNYKHDHPDTCSAPRQELITSFYQ
jgi:hypothetical protein